MRRLMSVSLLSLCFVGAPLLVGCDDTVEETKSVDVKDDGTVVREQEKVTENADGSVTKTESKNVDKPGD